MAVCVLLKVVGWAGRVVGIVLLLCMCVCVAVGHMVGGCRYCVVGDGNS